MTTIDLRNLTYFDSVHWLRDQGRITHEAFMRERHRRHIEGLPLVMTMGWDPNYVTVAELVEARTIGRVDQALIDKAMKRRAFDPEFFDKLYTRNGFPAHRAKKYGYEGEGE